MGAGGCVQLAEVLLHLAAPCHVRARVATNIWGQVLKRRQAVAAVACHTPPATRILCIICHVQSSWR